MQPPYRTEVMIFPEEVTSAINVGYTYLSGQERVKDQGGSNMEQELKRISCDPLCGFSVQSHDENEVLEIAKNHVRNTHPDKNYTDEEYRSRLQTV